MSEKLCVFCRHWYFMSGQQGYSEMTPGSSASMECGKRHFTRDEQDLFISTEEFRHTIEKAQTCQDYTEAIP